MRKDRDKKRKKTVQIVMGLFIVIIMVMSVLELTLYRNTGTTLQFNTYKFELDDSTRMYRVTINKTPHLFRYYPPDLADINTSPELKSILSSAQYIVYTFDPNMTDLPDIEQVRYEITRDIPIPSILAVEKNITAYESLPVAACSDATSQMPVVSFQQSPNASITTEGNCIILTGEGLQFYRLKDVLTYTYLGILK